MLFKHLVLKNTSWNSVQSFFLKLEGKLLSDSDSLVQVGMGANARFLLEPRFCGGLLNLQHSGFPKKIVI